MPVPGVERCGCEDGCGVLVMSLIIMRISRQKGTIGKSTTAKSLHTMGPDRNDATRHFSVFPLSPPPSVGDGTHSACTGRRCSCPSPAPRRRTAVLRVWARARCTLGRAASRSPSRTPTTRSTRPSRRPLRGGGGGNQRGDQKCLRRQDMTAIDAQRLSVTH